MKKENGERIIEKSERERERERVRERGREGKRDRERVERGVSGFVGFFSS